MKDAMSRTAAKPRPTDGSRSSIHNLIDLARFAPTIDFDGCLIDESPTCTWDLTPGLARSVADVQTSGGVLLIEDGVWRVVAISQREAVDRLVGHILGAYYNRNGRWQSRGLQPDTPGYLRRVPLPTDGHNGEAGLGLRSPSPISSGVFGSSADTARLNVPMASGRPRLTTSMIAVPLPFAGSVGLKTSRSAEKFTYPIGILGSERKIDDAAVLLEFRVETEVHVAGIARRTGRPQRLAVQDVRPFLEAYVLDRGRCGRGHEQREGDHADLHSDY